MKIQKIDPNNLPKGEVLAWNDRGFFIGKIEVGTGIFDGKVIAKHIGTLKPDVTHYALISDIEEEFKNADNENIYYYPRSTIGTCIELCPIMKELGIRIGSVCCIECVNLSSFSETGKYIICPKLNEYKKEAKNG